MHNNDKNKFLYDILKFTKYINDLKYMKYSLKNRIQTALFKLKRLFFLFLRRMQSHKLLAVYDGDLDGLLKRLNLYEKVINGKFHCKNCGCTITRENLGVIINENNTIQIYCISTSCKGIGQEKTKNDA